MRRRRAVIALALLTVVALAVWKRTHRHDARVVGRWLVTEQAPATPEQIRAALDRANSDPRIEWSLDSDGGGRMCGRQWAGSLVASFGSQFQWWSNGNGLRIKWGMTRYGWEAFKERVEDLYRSLTGDQRRAVHRYDFIIESPDLIRVQPGELPCDHSPEVLYLTRLPEEET